MISIRKKLFDKSTKYSVLVLTVIVYESNYKQKHQNQNYSFEENYPQIKNHWARSKLAIELVKLADVAGDGET